MNRVTRHRMDVVLKMVMTLIAAVLLGQLWLFTIALDAMENETASMSVAAAAAICSLAACASVWVLIRFFLKTEQTETGEKH
jgi:membrane protein YdbS with pleckstrin-like domain